MRAVAIVPARTGSKRLPGKNTRLLQGKPLVAHTLDTVIRHFDLVIFSSDDREILDSYPDKPNLVKIIRPPHLATDTSKVIDTVVYHAQELTQSFQQIWLCLPTCPLRVEEDVRNAQKGLTSEFDGVVTITDYDFPPALALVEQAGVLAGAFEGFPLAEGNSRSQDQEQFWRPNGALYGMWMDSFRRHKNFFRGRVRGIPMPKCRSIDVDTELDFQIAESLIDFHGSEDKFHE